MEPKRGEELAHARRMLNRDADSAPEFWLVQPEEVLALLLRLGVGDQDAANYLADLRLLTLEPQCSDDYYSDPCVGRCELPPGHPGLHWAAAPWHQL